MTLLSARQHCLAISLLISQSGNMAAQVFPSIHSLLLINLPVNISSELPCTTFEDLQLKLRLHTAILIGPISYPGKCDLIVYHKSTSSFSHECILLPLPD